MGVGLCALLVVLVACDAGEKPRRRTDEAVPGTCIEVAGWTPISTKHAPPASERLLYAVVDDKLLVVGHAPGTSQIQGALLDPCTDTWSKVDTTGLPPHLVGYGGDLPVTQAGPYAVWFYPGTENSLSPYDATIAAVVFDGTKRQWRTLPRTGPLADPRTAPATVWTGKELIVFGGLRDVTQPGGGTRPTVLGDGVAIDLARGTVRALSATGAPSARWGADAVWSNGRVVISGGCGKLANQYTHGECTPAEGAAQYDPMTNSWSSLAAPPPVQRSNDIRPTGPPRPEAKRRSWTQVHATVGRFDVVWGTVTEDGTGRYTGCDGPREPGQGCDPYEVTVMVPQAEGWRMQSTR